MWAARTGLGAAAVLAGALAFGPASSAQADEADTRALVAEAVQLRKQGRDADALPLLMQAFAADPNPRTASQLGLVEAALGYKVDAAQHLAEALDATDRDPWVRRNEGALADTLARLSAGLGRLAVDGSPPGAEVWVNDRQMGVLPLARPLFLVPGQAKVRVQVPGGRRSSQTVRIDAGKQEALTFVLAPGRGARSKGGDADGNGGDDGAELAVKARDRRRRHEGAALSHDGQFGLLGRLDYLVEPAVEPRFAVGFTFGVNDHAELQAAALLGQSHQGGLLGARFFLVEGRFKPALELAVPLLMDSMQIGVHGAAGVTVELGRHAAVFADLGVTVFPGASDQTGQLWVLPAGGAQLRF